MSFKEVRSHPVQRLAGRADYRGWALTVDTLADQQPDDPNLRDIRRWTLGGPLGVCLLDFAVFHLQRALRRPMLFHDESMLRMRLIWRDGTHP